VYDDQGFEIAQPLIGTGLSDREIARRSGVSRGTIRNWRLGGRPMRNRYHAGHAQRRIERPLDDAAYAYLLGMYLGDGSIAVARGHPFVRFFMDLRYPEIVQECAEAVTRAAGIPVGVQRRPHAGLVIVQASGPLWLEFFPQHGPGRKHTRRIELVGWQSQITARYVRQFIRGLIHSDGSRCINRFKTRLPSGRVAEYAYPRYFFTNYSADIRRILCEHCELLGIRWTQSNPRNISISHRDSVALLDEFVGPKA
jgi:hypothetical protein